MAMSPKLLPAPPAFFLAAPPGDGPARLLPEDRKHARKVLRLRAGDLVLGLDGRGHRWPLRILALDAREALLEPAGPPEFSAEPGAEGSELPWIEVAVAWPKKARVDAMIGRLVQLGAAGIAPLVADHRGPEPVPARATERHEKLAREACKQCGRTWLPELEAARTIVELAARKRGGALAVLDPRGGLSFDVWLRSLPAAAHGLGTRARPIVLVVGPEGGFTAEERAALLESGASLVWLGPYVLRVETAAEAAMAVAAAVLGRRHPEERA